MNEEMRMRQNKQENPPNELLGKKCSPLGTSAEVASFSQGFFLSLGTSAELHLCQLDISYNIGICRKRAHAYTNGGYNSLWKTDTLHLHLWCITWGATWLQCCLQERQQLEGAPNQTLQLWVWATWSDLCSSSLLLMILLHLVFTFSLFTLCQHSWIRTVETIQVTLACSYGTAPPQASLSSVSACKSLKAFYVQLCSTFCLPNPSTAYFTLLTFFHYELNPSHSVLPLLSLNFIFGRRSTMELYMHYWHMLCAACCLVCLSDKISGAENHWFTPTESCEIPALRSW